ncbi:unnamed protein product [Trichogramma brassicae]|uniref:Uncharacterized protein n=1 Tax=Trichogramma brassicae TaxID=86971 RepID=A0A6H5I629_9HYME|nr:unnamed protein product [Trichogramma brassicae]
MLSHRAELNAFLTSRATTLQYFLVPRNHLLPATAFRAVELTSSMASIVDRPFRKPYYRSERPPGLSVKASSRSDMIFSRIWPVMSSIHSGRYEDCSSGVFLTLESGQASGASSQMEIRQSLDTSCTPAGRCRVVR